MLKLLKKSSTWALSIITVVFTFVPESVFGKWKWLPNASDEANVILARVLAFIAALVISIIMRRCKVMYQV